MHSIPKAIKGGSMNHNQARKACALLAFLVAATALTFPSPVLAQEEEGGLDWIQGPADCPLGNVARIAVPDGYQFVDGKGCREILEWFGNPTNGSELGLIMPIPTDEDPSPWLVVFEYDPIGYVRDDDRDELDADKLLESIRKGTEAANRIRRENGWEEFHVTGWSVPPFYDPATNNLEWAILGSAESGESVNYSTRLLGRGGAMSADLVIDPERLDVAMPSYRDLIAGFGFVEGKRYAEFREGDKVARYGLTALIAGGAGAAAMKTGLLARFWKFLVFGFLAVVSLFRRLLGGKEKTGMTTPQSREPEGDEKRPAGEGPA